MRLLCLLAFAAAAFAQTDTGTITITASRNVTAVPDQVQFNVTLLTASSISLNDVVTRLANAGISAGDLSGVSSPDSSRLYWSFNRTVDFSKMSETNATLARLKQQESNLTFQVTNQQTSPDATAQACPLAALVSDSRKEADRLASAAGVHVGEIVRLSEGNAVQTPTSAQRQGDFSALLLGSVIPAVFGFNAWFGQAPAAPVACTLIVQFRLVP